MCNQTNELKNKENEMDNSSFSKENLKDFQTELSISEKGRTFLINASHGIYLR